MLVTLVLKKDDMLKTKIENYPLTFVQNEADKVFRIVTEYGMVEIICNMDHIDGFIKQLKEQKKNHVKSNDEVAKMNIFKDIVSQKEAV